MISTIKKCQAPMASARNSKSIINTMPLAIKSNNRVWMVWVRFQISPTRRTRETEQLTWPLQSRIQKKTSKRRTIRGNMEEQWLQLLEQWMVEGRKWIWTRLKKIRCRLIIASTKMVTGSEVELSPIPIIYPKNLKTVVNQRKLLLFKKEMEVER